MDTQSERIRRGKKRAGQIPCAQRIQDAMITNRGLSSAEK
jgi:hypothetical protein